jgi:hypothetical protein
MVTIQSPPPLEHRGIFLIFVALTGTIGVILGRKGKYNSLIRKINLDEFLAHARMKVI